MKKLHLKGEDFYRIVLDKSKDNCPMCDTPLKNTGFSFCSVFHGEARSTCCGAIYQILSYWVDKEKYPEEYAFAESLGGDTIYLAGVPSVNQAMVKKFDELTSIKNE